MVRARASAYRARVKEELAATFAEEHPPRVVAGSFAFGTFVTALPTLGTGLLLFVAVAAVTDRVSKLALFAPVVILNPVVKWPVYAASLWLGTRLLGPVPGEGLPEVSVAGGTDVLVRLLAGNLLLAVVFAAVGYVVAGRFVREYRRRGLDPDDVLPGEIAEQLPEGP